MIIAVEEEETESPNNNNNSPGNQAGSSTEGKRPRPSGQIPSTCAKTAGLK